jgi:NAD(P)H-quinone oxidoreductase subunit 5
MIDFEMVIQALGLTVVGAPALMMLVIGVSSLLGSPLSERATGRWVHFGTVVGLIAAVIIMGIMLTTGSRHVPISLGSWVSIGDDQPARGGIHLTAPPEREAESQHYHFAVKFIFNRLSVPFVILTFVLCGTIGAFATKYMHREQGYNRFFVFYALFEFGMVIASLAGTIETLFAGWELVGLSSALLIAFYQERPAPVRNGLWVWVVYRASDAALLLAAVVMHHMTGEGDFDTVLGVTTTVAWPFGHALLTEHQALLVGLLLLIAAAGKSALVPFSGWLPRAMEGPTPSSAVFYGALSVHLGAFLLLRVGPIIDASPWLAVIIVAVGVLSAVYSAFAGRVQTDIKSALSFASTTQLGLIVAEIGVASLFVSMFNMPFVGAIIRYVVLVHILGHACLRTLQFLRAPSLFYDYKLMENDLGQRPPRASGYSGQLAANDSRLWFYRLALERGYLDSWLYGYLVAPFLSLLRGCDSLERKWTNFLAGTQSRETEDSQPAVGSLEELL